MRKRLVTDNVRLLVGLVLLLMGGSFAGAEGFEHPGGLHSKQQIETTRKQVALGVQPWADACRSLLAEAAANLQKEPQPMADFSVPGFYVDPRGHRDIMGRLSEDAWVAYSCAVAYQVATGESRVRYGDKAIQVITAWATVNMRTGNVDGDLAMVDAGVGLVLAGELMTDYDRWSVKQRKTFSKWVRTVFLTSSMRIVERRNNWGDWGVFGCAAAHHFLDDAAGLDHDMEHIRRKIDQSIAADGSMPLELNRKSNGMWYTYFALAPLTAACQIAVNGRGVNLFHFKGTDGAGIETALDYLLRYCKAPDKYPQYKTAVMGSGSADGWPGNLFEAMSGIYDRPDYANWMKHGRPVMVHGHHYAWTVPTLLQTTPLTVNNTAQH